MAFRAPDRDGEATHVFPRGPNGRGGVILGGCRQKNNWNGEVDLEFAEVIKKRCCALVPQLGKPEDLRVIKHGVGFRREYFYYSHVLLSSCRLIFTQLEERAARVLKRKRSMTDSSSIAMVLEERVSKHLGEFEPPHT